MAVAPVMDQMPIQSPKGEPEARGTLVLSQPRNTVKIVIDFDGPEKPTDCGVIILTDNGMEICRAFLSGSPYQKFDENQNPLPRQWVLEVTTGGRYDEKSIWIDDVLTGPIEIKIARDLDRAINAQFSADTTQRPPMPPQHHSVALDALGAGAAYTGIGTGGVSWSHTLGAGSNFALDISGGNIYATVASATAATYDSVAWTSRGDLESNLGSLSEYSRSTVFGEKAPPTGTKTAAVTFAASSNAGFFQSRSWTGVDQTTPYAAATTGRGVNAGATNSAGAVSTPSNGALIDAFSSGGSTSLTASHTSDFKGSTPSFFSWGAGQHTFTAGSQTLSWTTASAGSYQWVHIIVPVNAAAAGGSLIKTIDGLAQASIKTENGLANASMKTFDGLTNV